MYSHFIDMITRGQLKDVKVHNLLVVTLQNTVQVSVEITFPSQPLRRQRDMNNQHVQVRGQIPGNSQVGEGNVFRRPEETWDFEMFLTETWDFEVLFT